MRRLLKWLGFGVFYWLILEAGAYFVLSRQLEGIPLYKRLSAVQEQTSTVAELKGSKSLSIRADGIHPFLGYLPRRYRKLPPNVDAFYDEGFYDPDSPIFSTDENDLVVAVTGGSVAGQFSKYGGSQELGPLLMKMPKYEGRNVRFVSLACGGFKQPQQLMSLMWLLSVGGHLDILINLDGYNEVALHERENQPHDVSLLYPRAWYPRVEAINVAPTMGELQYRRRLRREKMQAFQSSPVSWSPLRSLLWLKSDKKMETVNNTLERAVRGLAVNEDRDLVLQGPKPPEGGEDARAEGMAEVWLQASENLDRTCRAFGIEYFHFLQPNQYLEGSKTMGPEESAVALVKNNFRPNAVRLGYSKLLQRTDELIEVGVRFHDLRDVFKEVEEPIYKDNCCHVNDLGNVYIARDIAASIESW